MPQAPRRSSWSSERRARSTQKTWVAEADFSTGNRRAGCKPSPGDVRWIGMMKRVLLFVALTGCWSSSQPKPETKTGGEVEVTVSSVSLADDCPDPKTVGPKTANAKEAPPQDEPVHGSCVQGGDCNFGQRASCEQTTLQLSLHAKGGATKIEIKRIELLDASGKQLGTLQPRKPTKWADDGTYTPWDQVVAAGATMSASYSLSAPDWAHLAGGRFDPSVTYKVRVVVTVGDKEQSFEKEATVSTHVEAPVMT